MSKLKKTLNKFFNIKMQSDYFTDIASDCNIAYKNQKEFKIDELSTTLQKLNNQVNDLIEENRKLKLDLLESQDLNKILRNTLDDYRK